MARSEVEAAIGAVKLLIFPKDEKDENFAKDANDLIVNGAPSERDLTDAACYLRTAFETDLRVPLVRHGGTIRLRDDWTEIELAELWDTEKTIMSALNNALAAPLITDVGAHAAVFLSEWKFSSISALTKVDLDAAWAALVRSPLLQHRKPVWRLSPRANIYCPKPFGP